MRLANLIGLAFAIPVFAGAAPAPKGELVVGMTFSDSRNNSDAKEELSKWQPIFDDMGKRLKMTVSGYVASKHDDLLAQMKANKVQVAIMGHVPALEAVSQANAQVFAHVVNLKGGGGFQSLLITHKDSEINTIQDFLSQRGKYTYQTGEAQSTSGALIPNYYVFGRNNVSPSQVFKKVSVGNHKDNFMAVAMHQVSVASVASDYLEGEFKDENPMEYASIKVIWRSEAIPADPVLYRRDLDDETKKAIEQLIFSYGKASREREMLKEARGIIGFKRSSNKQLSRIADVLLFQEQQLVMNNERMADADKFKRSVDITRKFSDLQKYLMMD
ncbi:phosphate/phosphite/phosphonate ABC transporter substrate-binding protein [Parachitinimonas caeni]|uniref:Phosphate/phosphite/phosphonate ABC transporter substrate-binding protein n=1 Tax=Parachitinimonas caeni TaxID=3031301 RepID=A0ABT7DXU9_9NEIS|nr:phosphate/phosphite/phosphonate ABC transporter substrate-binding protein [Parachitinimonas caeni]MDK2124894.1 phosphate/phosphite/phosphonate ABC transporter substrate-binding protein [Parachitinimonas caeni]